ncbi:DUF695 domain-containing protein [Sphingobacterium alkalisoli]|uniref:DUF695 domain-containing protein n=1 Tax=Sphingobacterium alkalisoli TaxID=1874115 RepID=A0A4U0GXP9_9SPHI|nr:DUF695 domain-containing protein [Sphingobacterium alkalisoli]TJY62612.1 DUF695 domain-containing protein [Sphingobacterium alkalisoli]GGH27778.1 hypothetical protein GCM10011418_37940 [Sphingobacterium alkalisoli]
MGGIKDFWIWFVANEPTFYKAVKTGKNIEDDFFNKLSSKLEELKDGFFYLTGMCDDNTAELIFTPDGVLKNIVFVEELVSSAPIIPNWKFTALKPALDIENVGIRMADYRFDSENLSFYSIEHKNYPDEVDIVVAHNDYKEDDKSTIINGTYLFVDNYLGELNSVTSIDNLTVISKDQAEKELLPIAKLKSYLIWREKEFIEKYSGVRYKSENDTYSSLEATLNSGLPLLAIINTTLLGWENKASHPWILKVEIKYDGKNRNGMPDNETYELLNRFEDEIMLELKDFEGYLNIGRQTADSERAIYFACNEFRKPSKLLHILKNKYIGKLDLTYEIYKDKYWQSFERFMPI